MSRGAEVLSRAANFSHVWISFMPSCRPVPEGAPSGLIGAG
jgi:hypothetical protein